MCFSFHVLQLNLQDCSWLDLGFRPSLLMFHSLFLTGLHGMTRKGIFKKSVEEHILANVWKEGMTPLKILHDSGCIKHHTFMKYSPFQLLRPGLCPIKSWPSTVQSAFYTPRVCKNFDFIIVRCNPGQIKAFQRKLASFRFVLGVELTKNAS